MKFRPCIDIHKGKVKQIIGSTLGEKVEVNFESSKSGLIFANLFAQHNFSNGHICILDKQNESIELAKKIINKFPGWQIGGGISQENFQNFLDNGADKVIISSALFDNENIWAQAEILSKKVGRNNLVFDLSCQLFDKQYFAMKDKWKTKTNLEISQENLIKLSKYCSEFLIHDISVEGKNQGFNKDLVNFLSEIITIQNQIKITYAGGISSLENIQEFIKISNNKLNFTVGSSLEIYGGNMKLSDISLLENNTKKC